MTISKKRTDESLIPKQVYLGALAPLVEDLRFERRLESRSATMRFVLEAGLHAAGYLNAE
jgi:hypothetical protein